MKKTIILALVLLIAAFSVSAASVSADKLIPGDQADGSVLGDGFTLVLNGGSAVVNPAESIAYTSDGLEYSQMLTLTGDASLAFDAVAGNTLKLTAAVPENGSYLNVMISSADSVDEIGGESSDGGTIYYEYEIPSDGSYSLSSPDGNVSIYSLSIE